MRCWWTFCRVLPSRVYQAASMFVVYLHDIFNSVDEECRFFGFVIFNDNIGRGKIPTTIVYNNFLCSFLPHFLKKSRGILILSCKIEAYMKVCLVNNQKASTIENIVYGNQSNVFNKTKDLWLTAPFATTTSNLAFAWHLFVSSFMH